METKLELEKLYQVTHIRKGTFEMRIKNQSDEWVTGFITKVIKGSRVFTDEDITVRRSFCEFIPINN